jgi:hypothetical protein
MHVSFTLLLKWSLVTSYLGLQDFKMNMVFQICHLHGSALNYPLSDAPFQSLFPPQFEHMHYMRQSKDHIHKIGDQIFFI